MAKKKTKKRISKKMQKKLELRRKIIASSVGVGILVIVILILGVILTKTSLIGDRINATTASYITFKNAFESDNMKINSLKKMNDHRGMNLSGNHMLEFSIISDNKSKGSKYDVVIYPINNTVNYDYIKYYLTDENDRVIAYDKLSDVDSDKLGKILYSDKIDNTNKKLKLRLWIDKKYDKDIISSSFEVRVKLK